MIDVQNFVKTLDGKPVAVFGLGKSGLATIAALRELSVKVAAWDDLAESHEQAKSLGAALKPLASEDLSGYACLVLAPGVRLHHPEPHPVVTAAHHAGIEIICDIEILHRCHLGKKVIGITGTNGKSTVTALTAHILKGCGQKAVMGGNIGDPVLSLKKPVKDAPFVLELSSFQLDLCPTFTPEIAVLLNIAPDHLDRHGGMEEYIAAKEKIFSGNFECAVIGVDDEHSEQIFQKLTEQSGNHVIPVSIEKQLDFGIYIQEGVLYEAAENETIEVGDLSEMKIKGVHNYQNAAASYAVCRQFGLGPREIFEVMKAFPGLNHRQFPVRVINGVSYINDSKATNADAAARALACYRNIYWIAGGRPKEGGLDGLEPYMERVKRAYLIGEAMEGFGAWLGKYGVGHEFCEVMEEALLAAHSAAQAERGQPGGAGVVLLSPACASFDQYRNFEERGDHFTALVQEIEEEEAA